MDALSARETKQSAGKSPETRGVGGVLKKLSLCLLSASGGTLLAGGASLFLPLMIAGGVILGIAAITGIAAFCLLYAEKNKRTDTMTEKEHKKRKDGTEEPERVIRVKFSRTILVKEIPEPEKTEQEEPLIYNKSDHCATRLVKALSKIQEFNSSLDTVRKEKLVVRKTIKKLFFFRIKKTNQIKIIRLNDELKKLENEEDMLIESFNTTHRDLYRDIVSVTKNQEYPGDNDLKQLAEEIDRDRALIVVKIKEMYP